MFIKYLETICQSQFDLVIHSSHCTIMQTMTFTAPGSKSRGSKYVMNFYRRKRSCNTVHVRAFLRKCQNYTSEVPSPSIPLTSLSLPLLLPPIPFPFPPFPFPQKQAPSLRLGGLGEHFSSPSGSGRSPVAKRYLVNFKLKILPLVATNFRSFSGNETSNWDDWVAEW